MFPEEFRTTAEWHVVGLKRGGVTRFTLVEDENLDRYLAKKLVITAFGPGTLAQLRGGEFDGVGVIQGLGDCRITVGSVAHGSLYKRTVVSSCRP